MKRLSIIAMLLTFAVNLYAAFPASFNSKTVDVSRVTGDFDSFSWTWVGQTDQSNGLWFAAYKTNGVPASWIDLTGYYPNFRVSKRGTVYINLDYTQIGLSGSNIMFNVPRTNIPPNDTYQAEAWVYDSAATNNARVIAQGTINVVKSLYSDTNSFPFPANGSDLTLYLTKEAAASTYLPLAANSSVTGYVATAMDTGGKVWQWAPPGGHSASTWVAGTGMTNAGSSTSATGSLNAASVASLALADSATQPADLPALTNGFTDLVFSNATDFATAAQGDTAGEVAAQLTIHTNLTTTAHGGIASSAQLTMVSNLAVAATFTPVAIAYGASNNVSGSYNYQSLDLTGQGACKLHFPVVASTLGAQIALDIFPSTNTLTISTNDIAGAFVQLATNPAVNIPASKWTTCVGLKPYGATNWLFYSVGTAR